ncbi:PAS domain S-box protein [Haloarculaceae archaeon H-GB2-1]|nr:PAS domain S-box protein [Haloarculaceae archaeon H-GB2-1]
MKRKEHALEREREDLESELQHVFERVDDAFYAVDEEFRFTYVNDRAAELFGETEAALLGTSLWSFLDESEVDEVQDYFETAIESQEVTSYERYLQALGIWIDVRVYPSDKGLSVYFRDVTERKRRERELEQFERAVEATGHAIYVAEPDGTITYVNPAFEEMTGYDSSDVIGETPEILNSGHHGSAYYRELWETISAGEVWSEEIVDRQKNGELYYAEQTIAPVIHDGEVNQYVAVQADVSERKQRERELELFETLFATLQDGVYILDDEFRFSMVNDAYVEMTGYSREELVGTHCTLVIDDDISAESERQLQNIAAGESGHGTIEAAIQRADGTELPAESRFTTLPRAEGDQPWKVGVVRDISDRVDREQQLRRRIRQQEVITDLGQQALTERDIDALMAHATTLVADTLDTDYCKVLDLDAEREHLRLRHGVGWDDGLVGNATVSAVDDDSQAAYTLASSEPVVVTDLTTETRFSGPDLLSDHDVRGGVSVLIGPEDDPWGILGAHDTECGEFSENDVNFVQTVANILATAIRRHADEEVLVQQREQLAAVNSLNEVVRDITDAVIEQSTRTEIEETVCERLAATESYAFAWIGDVDVSSQQVYVRTEAGVEGYLDDKTVSVDPDDSYSAGATGRAFRTGEMQTTQDVRNDSRYDTWENVGEKHGFRSSAAIPVVHDGTTYGVLNVYAERPDAFAGEEGAVISQLGEIVGHAIAAADRKRALMSDEVVELEFAITDVFASLGLDDETDGRIEINNAVPLANDEFLVFGTATADACDHLESLVEALPHWRDLTWTDAENGTFELRFTEPPVLSVLASMGGSIESAVIEDGDYHMTLHLSPTVEVRPLIDAVRESYPDAQLLKRRQISKYDETYDRVQHALTTELTERQRTMLEAAYHAGFFEWPRTTSGESIAESMDVSPPTFHQHLRKAEQKVFESLLA